MREGASRDEVLLWVQTGGLFDKTCRSLSSCGVAANRTERRAPVLLNTTSLVADSEMVQEEEGGVTHAETQSPSSR